MKRLLTLLFLLLSASAQAQVVLPGADSAKVACVYNLSLPTLAPGQFGYLQCDANGRLLGTGGGGGGGSVTQGTTPWQDNITQFGGGAVATGTGPGGAGIPRVTISNDSAIANTGFNALQAGAANATGNPFFMQVTNFPATQTIAGTVTANQGGAPWSTTLSGTLPAFAAIPAFKIDQTTPGTTNKVSIGTDGQVLANPVALSPTDASSSISAANTFQTPAALASSAARKNCTVYNPPTAAENLLVYDGASGTPSATNAYQVVPGQFYTCNTAGGVITTAIQVAAATAGHAFVARAQ